MELSNHITITLHFAYARAGPLQRIHSLNCLCDTGDGHRNYHAQGLYLM